MEMNKTIENTKNAAPIATLPRVRKDGKRKPKDVGNSKMLCARSDNIPAAIRRVFLNERRDMVFKRIAQKRVFFYSAAIHDKRFHLRLLSTLKVCT
jgi:hypothetical protein